MSLKPLALIADSAIVSARLWNYVQNLFHRLLSNVTVVEIIDLLPLSSLQLQGVKSLNIMASSGTNGVKHTYALSETHKTVSCLWDSRSKYN